MNQTLVHMPLRESDTNLPQRGSCFLFSSLIPTFLLMSWLISLFIISQKKHNVRTFAGAVGGSVGVLAAVSTCLAISICRRRRRSARQHPRDREPQSDARSFHTDASEDPPEMQGPAPFTPRYFPGTTPLSPPPYTGSTGLPILSSHLTSSAAAPEAVHDTEPLDVPPPFSIAVSSPVPPVLLDAMRAD